MTFSVTILGSSAAMPSVRKHTAAHVLNVHEQFFLIDCGEGTQRQMIKYGIAPLKINEIFLTHLHGDHVFGIFGLISTLNMLGRRNTLRIYAPRPFGEILDNHIKYFEQHLAYNIEWIEVDTRKHTKIYENGAVEVYTVPLRHTIPCAGYHFKEKTPQRNIKKELIERYGLGIAQCASLKRGEDIHLNDGTILPNEEATYFPYIPRSYAYLSDTQYSAKAASLVRGVDLLFHETTFMNADKQLATTTGHSTTLQAAKIAKLAEAKRLLIGHFSSRYKDDKELETETRKEFAESHMAIEGYKYEIKLKFE